MATQESMMERVENAIAAAEAEYGTDSTPMYRRLARAAIEAMREPTDAMIDAGGAEYTVLMAWQAMISTALKEDGHE